MKHKIKDIHPCGHFIKVELLPVDETYEGSLLVRPMGDQSREQLGRDVGRVLEVGPIAYQGFAECQDESDWGVKVGMIVEFNRYNGKITRAAEEDERFKLIRIINDSDIVAYWEVEDESQTKNETV